jgi:hypothetical protein
MAQPAHNADLAASDFFTVNLLKQQIEGVHFSDPEAIKSTICKMFGEIDREVLISVFLDWIKRLESVIEKDGEYHNS